MIIHIIETETCTQYSARNDFITLVVISIIQIRAMYVLKVPREKGRRKIRSTYRIVTCGSILFFSTCYPRFPVHNESQLIAKEP